MPAPTDHELLVRTCRGDAAGAREFWSRFGPAMQACARGLLRRHGGEPAAADAVQTVLCRLLELDRRSVHAVADVPAFLIRSTRHAALNMIRSAERAGAREASRPAPTDHEAPAADRLALLDSLDNDSRELIILKHASGLTFDQIALCLDLNRNTVAARYRRAVESLRNSGRATSGRTLEAEANHV